MTYDIWYLTYMMFDMTYGVRYVTCILNNITNSFTGKIKKSYAKGDEYMLDHNVDGEFHHELMTEEPNGILPKCRAYFKGMNLPCAPSLQQDQAGGHGVFGDWSKKIEQNARDGKPQIDFHNQAA